MLYLLAILLPPLAVLMAGKPFQALLNVGLTFLFWIPGGIHAFMVVGNYYADKRTNRVIKAQERIAKNLGK
ncbi:MAG: YqaE/Pmp3 family membrane protein [Chloroflexi bacterium]|nr:YqaE/Pmp3 family membrane protein [Chloroflexota bacterium]